MTTDGEPSAESVVAALAFGRTARQARRIIGAGGVFFVVVFLVTAIAVLFVVDPASVLWVLPVSLALGCGITVALRRWGALSMAMLVADDAFRVRAVLGAPGISRLSKKLVDRAYIRRELLLGGAIVVGYLVVVAIVALLLPGRDRAVALLVLPLFWIGTGAGISMIRAALRIHPDDTPLESAIAAPLAAAYLQGRGTPDDLVRGIPADELVSGVTDSDMKNVARVAVALAHFRIY